MCSIGHRTGLFDQMAGQTSFTSAELAEAAELDERYVREWLSAMTAGGIVDFTPATDEAQNRFVLPAEHEMLVTRAGGPLNLAAQLQDIALLGQVEDDVVEAFRTGSGVPYSRYPAFQALMAEKSGARFDIALVSEMMPVIEGSTEALSQGVALADVGCGSGRALLILAEAYPASTFVGYDLSSAATAAANAQAADQGLTNVTFEQIDAAELVTTDHIEDRFDIVTTFDAIHDQGRPKQVLAGIRRALKPGGSYLCVEPRAETRLEDNLGEPAAPSSTPSPPCTA